MPSEVSVTPSCIAAMKRGGSAVIAEHRAGAAVALVGAAPAIRVRRTVTSAYSAATKNAVQQHQHDDADELEEERHAPVSGARVLSGVVVQAGARV